MSEQEGNNTKINLDRKYWSLEALFFIASLIIQVFIITINIDLFVDVKHNLWRYLVVILANAAICYAWINSQLYRLIKIENRFIKNILFVFAIFAFFFTEYLAAFKVYQISYLFIIQQSIFNNILGILFLLLGIIGINLKLDLLLKPDRNYLNSIKDEAIDLVALILFSIPMYCTMYTANNHLITLKNILNN